MSDTPRNRKNARKGSRCELEARSIIRDMNFPACRTVPMSGSLSWLGVPELMGDIKCGFSIDGREATVQCKSRAKGFAELYKWLSAPHTDLLWLKRDRSSPIVAMDARTFLYFLALVPQEHRLPPVTDRLAALRKAAQTSEYAAAALKQIEQYRNGANSNEAEVNPLVSIEIPEPGTTESESSTPF